MSASIFRLDYARQRAAALLPSTCTIWRNGDSLYTNVPCSVEDANQSTTRINGDTVPAGAFLVAFLHNQDVRTGDHIVESGRTLEVSETIQPTSFEARREVMAAAVRT